ncbi:MAG: 16S rRNA pseudouridine(516) synthase [Ndongobacter sp.]|nr:16S rRNA pseudouridine(516) synthase [Ndongobacter sp.]
MRIRLDRLLANIGVGSRNEVKNYIRDGLVRVNGEVERISKRIVDTGDDISVGDQVLLYQQYAYYMMNKPAGVLSATRDRRETVLDLLEESDLRRDLFPVGRLDRDTTGFLLLTDDGRLGHALLSPRHHVSKRYLVKTEKPLSQRDVSAFERGFDLHPEGIHTLPAKLELLGSCEAIVTIFEGKYHQVKRMFELCGNAVLQLHRLSMGPLELDEALQPGEYRPLSDEELEKLREEAGRRKE